MKLLLLFSAITLLLPAQDVRERFNIRLQRIEYYDAAGRFLGHSVENAQYRRLEFYDAAGVIVKMYPLDDLPPASTIPGSDTAVSGVKRWNRTWRRYEVFDSLGTLKGFYLYDIIARRWEWHWNRR